MKWPQNSKSFTLIELLVMCAALCIICALAIPSFTFLADQVLALELEELRQTIHYLRNKAMLIGRATELTFNPKHGSYSYIGLREKEITHFLPHTLRIAAHPGILGPPSSPRKKITSQTTFARDTIICSSDGMITSGTLYLCTKTTQAALTIAVSAFAFMRTYRFQNNRWCLWKN